MHSLLFALALLAAPPGAPVPGKAASMSFFALESRSLDGKSQPFSAYQGKVVLVVNTASECGYTPQYEGLEKLYEAFKDQGLVVLGFPSNEFGGQEPGTSQQIQQFCSLRYHVQFPMFEKLKTQGQGQSPVYAFLTAKHAAPKWNFHKYLVGKDGQVKAAFESKVAPESPELRKAIETALKE